MYSVRLKKHVYIAFDRPLMSLGNTVEILQLEWQKCRDWSTHEAVKFPHLIHGIHWRYDYLIFRKKVKKDVQ